MKFPQILTITAWAILANSIVVLPGPAVAQDTAVQAPLIVKDRDRIGVSGVVTNVRPRAFTVRTGETSIDVNIAADSNLGRILREGMEVYVEGSTERGRFNDPVIRADEIRITGYAPPNPPVVVLPPEKE